MLLIIIWYFFIIFSLGLNWPQPPEIGLCLDRLRPRSFGLGLGIGLEVLASAWPRSRCLIMLSGVFRAKIV